MTDHSLHFLGPHGKTIVLDQVVAKTLNLGTDEGRTLRPLIFTSMWGEYFTSHTRVDYIIWKTQEDKEKRNPENGEPLLLRDGVITYQGTTYHVDASRRHGDNLEQ